MSLDFSLVRQCLEAVEPVVGRVCFVAKDGFVLVSVGDGCQNVCLKEAEFALRPFSIFACSHGVRHLAVPVFEGGERCGVLVISRSSISDEVQVVGERLAGVLSRLQVVEVGVDVVRLEHVARFLPLLLSSTEIEGVCDVAVSHLVHSFKLVNCSILVAGLRGRYNRSRQFEPALSMVEEVLLKQLEQAKTAFVVRQLGDDVVTRDIEGVSVISWSVAAYPLVWEREFLGGLLIFFDGVVDVELVGVLCGQLALALSVVQRYVCAAENARTDPLTGLSNRVALVEELSKYLPEVREVKGVTSVAMVDVDDFKVYNDTRGHVAGDELLRVLSKLMGDVLGQHRVFRYGGEEFVVVFKNTGQVESGGLMGRLVEECRCRLGVTVSVGLLTCLNSSLGSLELIREADKALYQAKRRGKDRVCQVVVVDKNLGVIDVEEASSMGKYG